MLKSTGSNADVAQMWTTSFLSHYKEQQQWSPRRDNCECTQVCGSRTQQSGALPFLSIHSPCIDHGCFVLWMPNFGTGSVGLRQAVMIEFQLIPKIMSNDNKKGCLTS